MNSFKDRTKGFEAKFKHDEETKFKIMSRRNKLLGLWASEKFGLSEAEAKVYAKEVVMSDFEEPGDQDVVRKVLGDFTDNGIDLTEKELRVEMDRLMNEATTQIMSE